MYPKYLVRLEPSPPRRTRACATGQPAPYAPGGLTTLHPARQIFRQLLETDHGFFLSPGKPNTIPCRAGNRLPLLLKQSRRGQSRLKRVTPNERTLPAHHAMASCHCPKLHHAKPGPKSPPRPLAHWRRSAAGPSIRSAMDSDHATHRTSPKRRILRRRGRHHLRPEDLWTSASSHPQEELLARSRCAGFHLGHCGGRFR